MKNQTLINLKIKELNFGNIIMDAHENFYIVTESDTLKNLSIETSKLTFPIALHLVGAQSAHIDHIDQGTPVYMDDFSKATYWGETMFDCPLGLYEIFWKEGGSSWASVGYTSSGRRWFTPSNWINKDVSYLDEQVSIIERIVLLHTNQELTINKNDDE